MENYLNQITDYVLTQSWQIAALVALVAIVSLLLRNRSAHVRYLFWLVVLAKCLVPPFLTVPLAVLPQEKSMPAPIFERTVAPGIAPLSLPSTPVRSVPPARTVAPSPARLSPRQGFALAWGVGLLAFILIAATKALRTQFWLRRKRKPLPADLHVGIADLFSGFGLKTFPKVWLVEGIGQPFVWGVLRGSIYLPANFVKVNSAEHRRGVLGHELSHVLRFDAAVNVLQTIAQALFWFHPFVWWANKKIRAEREKCCDEMAIARLNAQVRDYSRAIVDTLVTEYESTRPIPSLAVAGPVKNIEERIKIMLRPGKKFYKRPSLPVAAIVTLTALLAVPSTVVLTVRAQEHRKTESSDADQIFSNPTNLGRPVNSPAREYDPSISSDELELYFNSRRPEGLGKSDIWVTTRKTKADPWGKPVNLGPTVNSPAGDKAPNISVDGLSLYFSSDRSGGYGAEDLWVTTRKTRSAPWGEPANLGPTVNSQAREHAPSISTDGLELYFSGVWEFPESPRPGGSGKADIWVTTRKTKRDPWGAPVNLGPAVNSPAYDESPSISGDGISLYFNSYRPGGYGAGWDLWVTRRKSTSDPWSAPMNLGTTVNSANSEINPDISRDGYTLYFVSNRPGGVGGGNDRDIWQAILSSRSKNTSTGAKKLKPAKSLCQAAADGDLEQVKLLLSQGADVNSRDENGKTPLHAVAFAPRGTEVTEVAELLIAAGADVSAKDKKGYTPLDFAAEEGHKPVAALLIEKGADVNAKDNTWTWTPLHSACLENLREMAELLLTKGADVNAKDKQGKTPLSVAKEEGHTEIVELLRKHGAKE